ncbi:acyl-CoA dehydrogenase family protein [Escherichia coli]
MGIDSLLIPEEHGGLDAGFVTLAAVWMELGRLGAPTYVLYQLPGGFNTFLREGTQEQIDKIMAFRGTGKQMWNSAMTSVWGAGSDVGSLKTTYTLRNGKIYLNGKKCFITSSAYTPYIVVMARDGASPDKPVYTEWFVDMSKPGINDEILKSSVCVWIAAVKSPLTTWNWTRKTCSVGKVTALTASKKS